MILSVLVVSPRNLKKVKITNTVVGKYYKDVLAVLDDVANKFSGITYTLRYGNGPYKQSNVPCLWFTVSFGSATYNFKYTLPLRMWGLLQKHTEAFVEKHKLDNACIKKLNKVVLIRMGLDFLFSNITVVEAATAEGTKNNIRKAWKVIESDIGTVYMPYGQYNTLFTHDVSNKRVVDIVNK